MKLPDAKPFDATLRSRLGGRTSRRVTLLQVIGGPAGMNVVAYNDESAGAAPKPLFCLGMETHRAALLIESLLGAFPISEMHRFPRMLKLCKAIGVLKTDEPMPALEAQPQPEV